MVAEEPSVLLQPSRGQHRQPGSQMLSRWWGSACRMEGTRREHWAVGSGVQIAVRYCRVPTSVGSDAGEHRPTAWFSLHGSEFVFPSDLQHTWNSQPVSVCWCWLAAQQSAQHPLPGAVKRMNVGDLREYNKVKGLLAPKFNMTHKTTVEKKIYIYICLISHWSLLLVPKSSLLCLALDSSDCLLRLEDRKQNVCLATASSHGTALLCQKVNRDPTDVGGMVKSQQKWEMRLERHRYPENLMIRIMACTEFQLSLIWLNEPAKYFAERFRSSTIPTDYGQMRRDSVMQSKLGKCIIQSCTVISSQTWFLYMIRNKEASTSRWKQKY